MSGPCFVIHYLVPFLGLQSPILTRKRGPVALL